MKILVTGAGGFIGKNLIWTLKNYKDYEVLAYHFSLGDELLKTYCKECDFVFHLAGVNRPFSEDEFTRGNVDFTEKLTMYLINAQNYAPIAFSSSIQAKEDNPYGKSKRRAEDILNKYGEKTNAKVMIYRLPNVFGKWCKPNYNSAVATFCHNAANNLPLKVNDPTREMRLAYIDDVTAEFMRALNGKATRDSDFCEVPIVYSRLLGEIAEIITGFAKCRSDLSIPNQNDELIKKLYSAYLSYLPKEAFGYDLTLHRDNRGLFAEFVRTSGQGQFSINVAKPNITKGNHWHHSKHEKFLAVSGNGRINLRKIDETDVVSYEVSGENPRVIEIPPGYTHNIENVGDTDLITFIWANENFDPNNPDTFIMEV